MSNAMAGNIVFFLLLFVCCGQLFAFQIISNDLNRRNRSLRLVQAVGLARHNIRAPLWNNLQRVTPKKWPVWTETATHLTKKGVLLEGKSAAYIKKLLVDEGLLPKGCPGENDVFIYANIPQRTVQTAKVFAIYAFKNCNVSVYYKKRSNKTDSIFFPTIRNDSDSLKNKMMSDMNVKIEEIDLRRQYAELNRILDLNNSEICAKESVCDFTESKNKVIIEVGKEPEIVGPLDLSNSIVDQFLMQYYNGTDMQSIAWGEMDYDKLTMLAEITAAHLSVRFNSSIIAAEVAKPILENMSSIFLNGKTKFTLLVGHDSTLLSVMKALNFKSYELRDQMERIPVGSKLFFLKYYDDIENRYFLKINYYYETTEQLRYGNMSMENPPYSTVLEMGECETDDKGYCPWEHFENVMKKWFVKATDGRVM